VRLERLRIHGLRCLTEVELDFAGGRSLLIGPNGAGKTSVLEGIHVLGRGRSFRTHDTRQLIQRGGENFAIYGEIASATGRHRLGVGLGAAGSARRVDGETRDGMAAMAGLLPVAVIDPGVHKLVEGGARLRRQFLDWAVFHVEHRYIDWWRQYRRALAQRNAGLKGRQPDATLTPWSLALASAGEQIHEAREKYAAALAAPLADLGQRLLGTSLEIRYGRGWRKGLTLAEALEETAGRDRQSGVTQAGPHRADWQVLWEGHPVRHGASRGQQKLAAVALVLAQELASREAGGEPGVLLVDDPAAELDVGRLAILVDLLDEMSGQQVVTALTEAQFAARPGDRVFHVERGTIRRVV
jgi:DNA replication and repair protein RecF